MKTHLHAGAMLTLVLLAGVALAHVGGGARSGGGGAHPTTARQAPAPHYSGASTRAPQVNNHPGYVSSKNTAVSNRSNSSVHGNVGSNVGNRTNIANNSGNRNTNVGTGNQVNNTGNRTHIGNTNIGNTVNRPHIGNTTVGNNSGNTTINRGGNTINRGGVNSGNSTNIGNTGNINRGNINNSGNRVGNNNINSNDRRLVNNGNIVGRETNVTNVNNSINRPVNVNAPGAGSTHVAGNRGYSGAWGPGYGGGWNRPGSWGYNRPWGGSYGWYRGGWHGWNSWPSYWAPAAVGVGVGAAIASAPIVYSNPYYVPVPTPVPVAVPSTPTVIESNTYVVPQELDYSKPIAVPTQKQVDNTDADVVKAAQDDLDAGRIAFKKGKYDEALKDADKAIHVLPGDANSHEFRALCLFAEKKYQDSAAAIYAVLAQGPGWDWNTFGSFYPDTETYTKQLRSLESFVKENPKDSAGHFLLAYHYLVLDEREAAVDQLKTVEKLQPKDQLAKSLADALEKDEPAKPAPK